jgi:YHS domain-containing protein
MQRGATVHRTFVACILGCALALPFLASADDAPPEGRRIALRGYDPVAYFVDGGPARGSRTFWYSFDDVVYLFRSADHREKFAADPERYAPQYAGYCAAGVSKGYKAEPDPEAWIIANGKLFVFQRKDRVPEFKKKIAELAAKANASWPSVKAQ